LVFFSFISIHKYLQTSVCFLLFDMQVMLKKRTCFKKQKLIEGWYL